MHGGNVDHDNQSRYTGMLALQQRLDFVTASTHTVHDLRVNQMSLSQYHWSWEDASCSGLPSFSVNL